MSLYTFEWSPGIVFLGVVLPLLIVPGFAVVALVVVVAVALAVAAAAVVGIPYLLVRSLRRHLAEEHQPATPQSNAAPVVTAIARPATAVHG